MRCDRTSFFLLILFLASGVKAQSLGELAKKDRGRREKEGKASRVIRNEDLRNIGKAKITRSSPAPETIEPVTAGSEAPAAGQAATAGSEQQPAVTPPRDALQLQDREQSLEMKQPQDETYWRSTIREARIQLKLAQNGGLVLELKANDLRNRFFTQSDGSTRSLIEQELKQTLADIEINRSEIAKAEENLKKLEEEAKKAGVTPAEMQKK